MIHFTAWGVEVKIWPGEILGIAMIAVMIWLFWRAQRDASNPIDFSTMIVWPGTQQTSVILFLTLVAGMTGIWVVIDMEFRSKLTGEIFLGFLGVMVLGKGMTEWVNAWKDKPAVPAVPAAPNQIIGSAAQVNAAPPAPPAQPAPATNAPPAAAHAASEIEAPRRKRKAKGKR
jgi:hypothetical protein